MVQRKPLFTPQSSPSNKFADSHEVSAVIKWNILPWGHFLISQGILFVHIERSQWHPTPVLLPGKSHGWRNLEGCSPWGRWGSDTTERLHFPFSLSCSGEGNGSPLWCSCLENPRDGEPGGLLSMGLHRVGHDWSDLAAALPFSGDSGASLVAQTIKNPPVMWGPGFDP